MQHPPQMEHYKSDIEDHEYQIKRYQRFNLKPNRENVGSVSKSRLSGILSGLRFPELYTDHSSGSINGDEEVPALALISHLWQVLDVDMNEADGVVREALILWLVVLGPRHVSEVPDAMPS